MASLTCRQWQEWRAFYAIEPFGEYREELRNGLRMAQYANCHPFEGQTEPLRALDFMNFVDRPPEETEPELTPEEAQARIDKEIFGL